MPRQTAILSGVLLCSLLTCAQAIAGVLEVAAPTAEGPGAESQVAAVLDDFHLAASEAAGERYFDHFALDAIFLGTDPGERWSVGEFRAFADPYFSRGQGWTYLPVDRHVVLSESGELAWFDELLDNDSYGRCRGSGVLRKTESGWKIVQYNLTMVIPNEVARDVASMIREASGGDAAVSDPVGDSGSSD